MPPPTRARHELVMPALLLLGPIFHLLRSHGYPLLRAEVLLVAVATIAAGLLIGVAIHRGRPGIRIAVMAALLAVVLDLYLSGGSAGSAALVLAAMLAAVWVLRTHITTIAFAVSLPVLASTMLPARNPIVVSSRASTSAAADPSLPPVFHIILDEHAGIAALAHDTALARDITAWYEQAGFRLYANAYSPYFDTYNALPNLVNFTARPTDGFEGRRTGRSVPPVRENRYFDDMRARGYGIRVYQSDYLDFCAGDEASVMSCVTYPVNSLSHASSMQLPVPAHARMVATYILSNQSAYFEQALVQYHRVVRPVLAAAGVRAPRREWHGSRVTPPIGEVLDRIENHAALGAGGQLFFAHLLMPHYPYQYDAQCRVHERVRDRLDRVSPSAPEGLENTAASRERRLELYGEQLRCLTRELGAFLVRLDSLGAGASAIVILQGDHGSRIVVRRPAGRAAVSQLSRQDVLDGYSTLFAVKGPGIPGGTDAATLAIGEGLSTLVASGFRTANPAAADRSHPVVYLVDRLGGAMIPLDYAQAVRP